MFACGYTNCDTILADFIMKICFSEEILQHNWRLIKPSIPEVKNTNFFYDDILDIDVRKEYLNNIYNKILSGREALISTSYMPDTKWLNNKEMHVVTMSNKDDEYIVIEPKQKIHKDTKVELFYRDANIRFNQNLEKKLSYLEFYVDYELNKIYLKNKIPDLNEQHIYDIRYQIKNDEIYTWYVSLIYPWQNVMYETEINRSILCWRFGKEIDEFGRLISNKGMESPLFTCCFHHVDTKKYVIDTWLPIQYYITWDHKSVSFMFCEEPTVKMPIYGWCFFGIIDNIKQADFNDYHGNFGSFGNFKSDDINLSGTMFSDSGLYNISVDVISYKYEESVIYEEKKNIINIINSNIFINLADIITLLDSDTLPAYLSMKDSKNLKYLRTEHEIVNNSIKFTIKYLLPYPQTMLSGYVWIDNDANDGIMQLNEQKLQGVKINLIETLSNNVILSTTTDNNGFYNYQKFDEGLYNLHFDYSPLKSQYGIIEFTKKDVSTPDISSSVYKDTGLTDSFNVVETDLLTFNAGVRICNDKIYGYTWKDKYRADGIWALEEEGINGVIVSLYDFNNVEIQKTISSTNGGKPGYYEFTKIYDGFYYVHFDFSLTSCIKITKKEASTDLSISSSVNPITQRTDIIEIRNVKQNILRNCGLIKLEPVIIKGKAWFDSNRNGLIEESIEAPAKDIQVKLLDEDGNTIFTKKTLSDGSFSFNSFEGFHKLQFDYSQNEFFSRIKKFTNIVQPEVGKENLISCVLPDSDGYSSEFEVASYSSPSIKNCGIIRLEPIVIKGRVWFDNDSKDGLIDEGIELFAKNVQVKLLDEDEKIVSTKTTLSDGSFSFNSFEGFHTLHFDYSQNEFANKIRGFTDIVRAEVGKENLISCVLPDNDGYSSEFEALYYNSPLIKNCGLLMPIAGFEIRYVYEGCSFERGYQGILLDYDTNRIILEFNTFNSVTNLYATNNVTYLPDMYKLQDLENGVILKYKNIKMTIQDLAGGNDTSFRIKYEPSGGQNVKLGFYLMNKMGNSHDFHTHLMKVVVNDEEYSYTNWNVPGIPSANYVVGDIVDFSNIMSYQLDISVVGTSSTNPMKPVAIIDTYQSNEEDMFVPILNPNTNKPYSYNP